MMRRFGRFLTQFGLNERGVAAAEMTLWLSALTLPIINAVDLSFFTYQRMQVEAAANAAVNAAWHDCDSTATTPAAPPATITCKAVVSGVLTDMQNAAQSTSLGTLITLPTANIVEGYYCATSSGTMTASTTPAPWTAPNAPTTAPTVPTCTGSTALAGDYISATVTFTYKPLFASASILTLLGSTVTKTAYLRLDN